MSGALGRAKTKWQFLNHLKRIVRRRRTYIQHWFSEIADRSGVATTTIANTADNGLQPGDQV
jgi:hypothetical protein